MSTSPIADSQRLLALEKHAEQWALTILRGATFTDCLKINGIAPTCEIMTPEGKMITFRGSDVYDNRTWKKFLASINQDESICQLTEVRDRLAEQYKTWLLHEHTARYQAIVTEADLGWLERVIILAVTRHIMEQKYAAYTSQGLETFADPRTAIEMGNLLLLNHVSREIARSVHHIIKEPAQAQQLIAQFYEENFRQMQAQALLMHEALPPGTMASLALTAQKEEEPHE